VQLIRVPREAENVEEYTIAAWVKHEGDPVEAGDVILEALTDKASFQIEAEQRGVLRRIVAPANSTVPVGYIVGIVAAADQPLPDVAEENERILRERAESLLDVAPAPAPDAEAGGSAEQPAGGAGVAATPAARRRAREAGVSLEVVADKLNTQGVLHETDIERYLQGRSR